MNKKIYKNMKEVLRLVHQYDSSLVPVLFVYNDHIQFSLNKLSINISDKIVILTNGNMQELVSIIIESFMQNKVEVLI